MKKIFTILFSVILLAGCNNWLDTENLTSKTTANFPETEKDANEMITAIYAHLLFESPENSSEYYIAQLASDDCLGGNLSYSGNCATNFLLYKDNLNGFLGIWDRCYTLINRANNAIATLGNVKSWSSDSEKDRCFGEAYFLRAFAYYELAQVFGGVPVRTTIEAINIPRNTVEEVYQLIENDLKKAIELLPAVAYMQGSPMTGHANKYAAEAFMARVYLFYTGRYAKETLPDGTSKAQVVEWLDDVIKKSGYKLVTDQRNLWAYSNQWTETNDQDLRYNYVLKHNLKWEDNSAAETIFANKHNMGCTWTYTQFSNTVAQFYSPSGDNLDKRQSYPFGNGWGAGPVSPAMVDEWKEWSEKQAYINPDQKEDPRLTGSIWSYTAYDPNVDGNILLDRKLDDSEPDYTVSYRYYEQTGYFNKKYININSYYNGNIYAFNLQRYPGSSSMTSNQLLQNYDLIHIRFADVLLMHSELTETNTGLNAVRNRSGLADVAYSVENLRNERRYEFAFESLRWWDILRWSGPSLEYAGQLLNKQTGFDVINAAVVTPMVKYDYAARLKATEGYWPIPQDEIDISDGVIKQNPGWDASAMFTDWTKM
ncbi:MAG: RagB/SusD family nutrient uptake outer membrane protein [Bacteroidales bacterium]|nr:RagB/SusD family nutrient uptake outer membrane protein [Bacteroidales bacterium]